MQRLKRQKAFDPGLRNVSSGLAGVVLAALSCGLTGCSRFCRDTEVSRQSSPDGNFVAVVFYRNCGATTPFTTEISVLRSVDRLADGSVGNIFSMADPPGTPEPLSRNGVIDVRLNWRSPQRLAISTPRRAVVGKRVDSVNGIKIEYSSFD